jgi:hypothetical protein
MVVLQPYLSIREKMDTETRRGAGQVLELMPVFLTTQEAEIRRITVRSHSGQIENPSQKKEGLKCSP